jgi:hypothetical protein
MGVWKHKHLCGNVENQEMFGKHKKYVLHIGLNDDIKVMAYEKVSEVGNNEGTRRVKMRTIQAMIQIVRLS